MKLVTESFSTIEQYTDAFAELSMYTMQLSSGAFDSRHQIVMLPNMALSSRSLNAACFHHGTIDEEIYFVFLPHPQVSGKFCGKEIRYQHLLICDNTRDYISQYAKGASGFSVTVEKSRLCGYLGFNHGMAFPDLAGLVSLNFCLLPQIECYKARLVTLLQQVFEQSEQLHSRQAQLDIEERICILLANAIAPALKQKQSVSTRLSTRQNIVTRSLSYIREHTPRSVSVLELCEAAYCSLRTLEYAFKSILDMTPKQYLSLYRMHQIHQVLLTGGLVKVEPVIQSFGIINTGRFAKDYYNLFGEYPKQTVKRRLSRMS